jgi:PBP1b-binding outer membrane lipoprotein LpoB
MIKKKIIIVLVFVIIVLYGCSNIKSYSFETLLSEKVEDNEHNRNINLLKINIDSIWQDDIND